MDRTGLLWTITVFFGATVAFGLIRKATQDQSVALSIGLQGVVLVLIVGVIFVVVKRRE